MTMLPMYATFIDGGNTHSKGGHVQRGGEPNYKYFLSAYTDGKLQNLLDERSAGTGDRSLSPERLIHEGEYVLNYKGQEKFYGELASMENQLASSGRGDPNRYWDGTLTRLMLIAVASTIPEPDFQACVVTGLPRGTHTTKTVDAVVKSLVGRHQFILNGQPRTMLVEHPEHVRVLQEGAAAARYLVDNRPGVYSTVDIGGYSTDITTYEYVQETKTAIPVASLGGFIPVGMENVGDLINASYQSFYNTGASLSIRDRVAILKAYANALSYSYPEITMNRKTVPSSLLFTWAQEAVITVGKQITDYLAVRWKSGEQGEIATRFKKISLIGGGAYCLQDVLEKTLPGLTRTDMPHLQNMRSYGIVSSMLLDKLRVRA